MTTLDLPYDKSKPTSQQRSNYLMTYLITALHLEYNI